MLHFFSIKPNGEWTNEAAIVFKSNKATLQMEIINFQEDSVLLDKFKEVLNDFSCELFWAKWSKSGNVNGQKYPELKQFANKLSTIFGSTYIVSQRFLR